MLEKPKDLEFKFPFCITSLFNSKVFYVKWPLLCPYMAQPISFHMGGQTYVSEIFNSMKLDNYFPMPKQP